MDIFFVMYKIQMYIIHCYINIYAYNVAVISYNCAVQFPIYTQGWTHLQQTKWDRVNKLNENFLF